MEALYGVDSVPEISEYTYIDFSVIVCHDVAFEGVQYIRKKVDARYKRYNMMSSPSEHPSEPYQPLSDCSAVTK